jgi:lactate dehydrogenase-like 2-hydroxyacid dehydrogenase
MSNNDRYSRQKDIIPAERINNCRATVVGVGAIGRQVASQLAAIGIPWLQQIYANRQIRNLSFIQTMNDSKELTKLATFFFAASTRSRPDD